MQSFGLLDLDRRLVSSLPNPANIPHRQVTNHLVREGDFHPNRRYWIPLIGAAIFSLMMFVAFALACISLMISDPLDCEKSSNKSYYPLPLDSLNNKTLPRLYFLSYKSVQKSWKGEHAVQQS